MNLLKRLYHPIARGNAARLGKYGLPETLEENTRRSRMMYRKYRETQIPRCRSAFESGKQLQEVDTFKEKFEYWDEWSGSQFVRRENPRQTSRTKTGTVCRSNPVTGFWEVIQ